MSMNIDNNVDIFQQYYSAYQQEEVELQMQCNVNDYNQSSLICEQSQNLPTLNDSFFNNKNQQSIIYNQTHLNNVKNQNCNKNYQSITEIIECNTQSNSIQNFSDIICEVEKEKYLQSNQFNQQQQFYLEHYHSDNCKQNCSQKMLPCSKKIKKNKKIQQQKQKQQQIFSQQQEFNYLLQLQQQQNSLTNNDIIINTDQQNQNQIKIENINEQSQFQAEILINKLNVLEERSQKQKSLIEQANKIEQNKCLQNITQQQEIKNIQLEQQFKINEKLQLIIPKSSGGMNSKQTEKSLQNQEKQYISPYHNFSKLYFNSLIKLLQQNIIWKQFNKLPQKLQQQLQKVINDIKQSGTKQSGKQGTKTDLYSHAHYQLMFMKLNSGIIDQLTPKSKELHQQIFGDSYIENLEFVNHIKQCFYLVFQNIEMENEQNQNQYQKNYWQKLQRGIQTMNQEKLVKKFT